MNKAEEKIRAKQLHMLAKALIQAGRGEFTSYVIAVELLTKEDK